MEIAPIDDACGLHNMPFRSAPTNICTSVSAHARGVMLQAVASDARPWRAVVAMYGRNGRSGGMRFEVHSALPMLLLHFSGANDCATGGTGLVQTQDDR